jgi:hypothetical protein
MPPPLIQRKIKRHAKMHFSSKKYVWILFIFIPLVSCQTIGIKYPDSYDTKPPVEYDAEHLLSAIKNKNSELETFKGIGNLKLINNNTSMNARAVWMGTHQGNFRVEIFGFPGQSTASYSNNGKYSYVYFPMEGHFYIISDPNPSLEKILTISITSNDLSSFLSGKIPVYEYDADQAKINVSDEGYELSLQKGFFGKRKKLYIDKHNKNVWKIESFNVFGSLKYRTKLTMMQSINGYSIPFEINISNNDGNRLRIYIDKYWTNVPAPLSSFTLTPPN